MKILFISERILWKGTGAEKVSNSLLCALPDVLGEDNIDIVTFSKDINKTDKFKNCTIYDMDKSTLKKVLNKLKLNIGGINNSSLNKILQKIENNKYEYVFLDSSDYGKLAKKIKRINPNIKIIVFFHDVSKFWIKSLISSSNNIKEKIKLYIQYPACIYNEYKSIKNLDICITLNKRDGNLINKEYGLKVDNYIPVTIKDNFNLNKILTENTDEIDLLFIGAYYLPNIQGIKWFINEVFPSINAKLTIVGNGMEKIRHEIDDENVEILGFVEDLAEVYYNANCVIAPIFDGGGMKVKIAEALMYGKTIFGTNEALEGYEFISGKMGEKCNTKQEFINKINNYIVNDKMNKFNLYSREAFINKYDYSLTVKKIKDILNVE